MASLFELNKAIEDFELEVNEDGEVLNIDELDELKLAREDKIEGIGLWVKNLEAEKAAVKAEKQNMADREKRLEKKIESLKGYLSMALNGQKFSTPKVTMGFRKSVSVNIPDEMAIPEEYCNFTVVRKPDKTMIKNALSAGKDIFGAELVERQNLQIR